LIAFNRARPREMALYGLERGVEKRGDVFERMAEDVLQDDDAPLGNGKLDKSRHGRPHRFLAHQDFQGVGGL
jgi:hypothetical protein